MAFITIRKRVALIVLSAILAAVAIAATVATVASATRVDNGRTIVIDAGHGGADGGVTGVATGTRESDINLSIAKSLATYFRSAGYNAVLTRTDAGAVCGGLRYSKNADMRARRDAVNDSAPDLVISIHCNSYPIGSVRGAQVFFASGASEEPFASAVQSYFNDVINERPRSAMVGDYYILNCSPYPSILCECGFLSNAEEEAKLLTASYQQKVAYSIFSAVDSVFGGMA